MKKMKVVVMGLDKIEGYGGADKEDVSSPRGGVNR